MDKDTVIPVKFNRELTFKEIEAFADMCIDFGRDRQIDVTHISQSAVAKRAMAEATNEKVFSRVDMDNKLTEFACYMMKNFSMDKSVNDYLVEYLKQKEE